MYPRSTYSLVETVVFPSWKRLNHGFYIRNAPRESWGPAVFGSFKLRLPGQSCEQLHELLSDSMSRRRT